MYDSLSTDFDGTYIASIFLNPGYKSLLEGSQLTVAKEFLNGLIKMENEKAQESEETSLVVGSLIADKDSIEEPPLKRFKHLNRVGELLKRKEDEKSQVDSQ